MVRVDIDLNSEHEEIVEIHRLLRGLKSKERVILDIIEEHAELNEKVKSMLEIKRGARNGKRK